jgi:radical SAM protein with 4Fe4S-binding SPASM domain
MSSQRFLAVIDELADSAVLELGIGGGEPLLHPDLMSFLRRIQERGMNAVVTTNGLLVNAEIAAGLEELKNLEIRVSFDGSMKVHDDIRGDGVYQKAIAGLKILLDNGVAAVARLTLCNDSPTGLAQLFDDLAGIGAKRMKASVIEPVGRASLKQNQYLARYPRDNATATMLVELAKAKGIELKLAADMGMSVGMVDGEELRQGRRQSCGAGIETGYISPTGNVQPCSGVTSRVFGNIKSAPFMSVWNGPAAKDWKNRSLCHDSWFLCRGSLPSTSEEK